jgi:hypothetical protein
LGMPKDAELTLKRYCRLSCRIPSLVSGK